MKKTGTRDIFSRGYSRKMCKNLLVEFKPPRMKAIPRDRLLAVKNENNKPIISEGKLKDILAREEDRCSVETFTSFFDAVLAFAKKEGYHNTFTIDEKTGKRTTQDRFSMLEKEVEKIKEFVEYEYNYKHFHMLSGEDFDFHIRHELNRKQRILLCHFFDVYIQIGMGAGSSFFSNSIKKIPTANLQWVIDKAYDISSEDIENVSAVTFDMSRVISVTKLAFMSKKEIKEIYDKYFQYEDSDLFERIKEKIQKFEEKHTNMSFFSFYRKEIFEANQKQLQLLILWLGLSHKGKDLLLDYIFGECLQIIL